MPAVGAPYSIRSIEVACRILDQAADSELRLVYMVDVPRALGLQAALPAEESMAQDILAAGQEAARAWGVSATSEVLRGRESIDTLLKYVAKEDVQVIVLGARPDELRGLPRDMTREIVQRAECPVILDYISAEV